jgi:hypothetical protein
VRVVTSPETHPTSGSSTVCNIYQIQRKIQVLLTVNDSIISLNRVNDEKLLSANSLLERSAPSTFHLLADGSVNVFISATTLKNIDKDGGVLTGKTTMFCIISRVATLARGGSGLFQSTVFTN